MAAAFFHKNRKPSRKERERRISAGWQKPELEERERFKRLVAKKAMSDEEEKAFAIKIAANLALNAVEVFDSKKRKKIIEAILDSSRKLSGDYEFSEEFLDNFKKNIEKFLRKKIGNKFKARTFIELFYKKMKEIEM